MERRTLSHRTERKQHGTKRIIPNRYVYEKLRPIHLRIPCRIRANNSTRMTQYPDRARPESRQVECDASSPDTSMRRPLAAVAIEQEHALHAALCARVPTIGALLLRYTLLHSSRAEQQQTMQSADSMRHDSGQCIAVQYSSAARSSNNTHNAARRLHFIFSHENMRELHFQSINVDLQCAMHVSTSLLKRYTIFITSTHSTR